MSATFIASRSLTLNYSSMQFLGSSVISITKIERVIIWEILIKGIQLPLLYRKWLSQNIPIDLFFAWRSRLRANIIVIGIEIQLFSNYTGIKCDNGILIIIFFDAIEIILIKERLLTFIWECEKDGNNS